MENFIFKQDAPFRHRLIAGDGCSPIQPDWPSWPREFHHACGLWIVHFHHRCNFALTSGTGIFTMMERHALSAPIFPAKGIGVIYWVAYQRGSFSLKERYLCPERARSRCSDLITKARYIRIVPAREGDPPFLTHCFELPAAMSATGPV